VIAGGGLGGWGVWWLMQKKNARNGDGAEGKRLMKHT
jgi:hypothetical protein